MRPHASPGRATIACTVLLAAACESPTTIRTSSIDGTVQFLRSNAEVHTATTGQTIVNGTAVWFVELTIWLTFRNYSTGPVYISACRELQQPRLEKLVGDKWEAAYIPPRAPCADSLIRVRPTYAYPYEFRIRAYDPASPVEPAWLGGSSIVGLYRVNWADALWTDTTLTAQLPLEQRVSNQFHVTGVLP